MSKRVASRCSSGVDELTRAGSGSKYAIIIDQARIAAVFEATTARLIDPVYFGERRAVDVGHAGARAPAKTVAIAETSTAHALILSFAERAGWLRLDALTARVVDVTRAALTALQVVGGPRVRAARRRALCGFGADTARAGFIDGQAAAVVCAVALSRAGLQTDALAPAVSIGSAVARDRTRRANAGGRLFADTAGDQRRAEEEKKKPLLWQRTQKLFPRDLQLKKDAGPL